MLGIRIEDENGIGVFRSDYAYYFDRTMTEAIDLIGDRTPIPHPCEVPNPALKYEGAEFHKLFTIFAGEARPIDSDYIFIWNLEFFHTNVRISKHFIASLRDKKFRIKIVSIKKPLAVSPYQMVGHRRKVKCVSVVNEPYDFYKLIAA